MGRQRLLMRNGVIKSEAAHLEDMKREAAINTAKLSLWPRLVNALTEFERIHYVMTDDHENEEERLLQKDVTPLLREIAALQRNVPANT